MCRNIVLIVFVTGLLLLLTACNSGLPSDAKRALDAYVGRSDYQIQASQTGHANEIQGLNAFNTAKIEELWCVITGPIDYPIRWFYLYRIGLSWQVSTPYSGTDVNEYGGFRANNCTIG